MQPRQTTPVIAAVEQAGREPHAIGAALFKPAQQLHSVRRFIAVWQCQNQKLSFGKFEEIVELEMAFALFDPVDISAALAAGQQLAQPSVSRAVARIDQDIRRAVDEDEAGA